MTMARHHAALTGMNYALIGETGLAHQLEDIHKLDARCFFLVGFMCWRRFIISLRKTTRSTDGLDKIKDVRYLSCEHSLVTLRPGFPVRDTADCCVRRKAAAEESFLHP